MPVLSPQGVLPHDLAPLFGATFFSQGGNAVSPLAAANVLIVLEPGRPFFPV